MKVDIPLTYLIHSLYNDYRANKNQHKHFCKLVREFKEEDETYGISGSFIHGTALQGEFETKVNMDKYGHYLKTLLTMHDNWNNIDPEVEEIKQKFYGEENE